MKACLFSNQCCVLENTSAIIWKVNRMRNLHKYCSIYMDIRVLYVLNRYSNYVGSFFLFFVFLLFLFFSFFYSLVCFLYFSNSRPVSVTHKDQTDRCLYNHTDNRLFYPVDYSDRFATLVLLYVERALSRGLSSVLFTHCQASWLNRSDM